jgi:hypothetical protein
MNTKDMPDETKLPGHGYTLGEMRAFIATMRKVNDEFYWLCFHAGIGSSVHAYIEFAGLQSKFIDLCQAALDEGIEFPFANQHAKTPWPMEPHHAEYLGEKFHCIYGFAIGANPVLREVFIKSGLGEENAPFDMAAFFDAKAAWSLATFGPGDRYEGVVAHIRKELGEIEKDPTDLVEWVDVALLAMDGAWRATGADGERFVEALLAKHRENLARKWARPGPDGVIEHVRDGEE